MWVSYFNEPSVGVWESSDYRAAAFIEIGAIRLDIQRKDEKDGITWDELQKIKNECGFKEFDAIEFYPSEENVINNGNFRHLYVLEASLPWVRTKNGTRH